MWFCDVFLNKCGLGHRQRLILEGHSYHKIFVLKELDIPEVIHVICLTPRTGLIRFLILAYNAAYSVLRLPISIVNKFKAAFFVFTVRPSTMESFGKSLKREKGG